MALTLAEKVQRQIDAEQKKLDKVNPRFEKAKAALDKKVAAHDKRTAALEVAKGKFAVVEEKRDASVRYIDAMKAAINPDGTVGTVPAEPEGDLFDAVVEAEDGSELVSEGVETDDVEDEVL